MTVSELITNALKRIGAVAKGNTPAGDDILDGLQQLNDLIDGWATERLTIFSESRTTFTITSGTQDYLVGTGAVVNVARPVFVTQLGNASPIRYYDSSATVVTEIPLDLLTVQGWRTLPQKSLTGPLPAACYYNPTVPSGTISLWPIPTSTSLRGVLYAPAAVGQVALADTLVLPPGYRRALRDNLAVEMCADWDFEPSGELRQSAIESKANLKRANIQLMDLPIDAMWAGHGGRYNINTDQGG